MPLHYSLTENLLTPQPDDYTARVQNVQSHNLDSIATLMLQRGSTLTEPDILATLKLFFTVSSDLTARGEAINTPLFRTSFSVAGVFNRASDTFDSNRHEVKVNVTAGKILKDTLEKIRLEKITVPENAPHIIEVEDSVSSNVNSQITAGGVLKITGSVLKIEGEHPDNGVYFIAADGTATKVVTLVENKPAQLIVMIPTLEPRTYRLQVTTQHNNTGAGLKNPRTGTFGQSLTVV